MAQQVVLRSKDQILGNLIRKVVANSDLSDVAPGSSLSMMLEGVAQNSFKRSVDALKILENTDVDSLDGTGLDKKALSMRLPDGKGGYGRLSADQSSGPVIIGSSFQKISSKLYAGKPTPFAGSRRLFLEDASGFTPTGQIYIGRGTVSRFEGPISYSSVTNSGSFWVVELDSPLTKDHLSSDLVVMAQGGDRTIPAGSVVSTVASSNLPAVTFTINSTVVIPDGEAETSATVTCTQFGEVGNALAGAVKVFSNEPFAGATVTNPTSYVNGKSTESNEDLRKRIKVYPSTLSRGTRLAILAAVQGLKDPASGKTITNAVVVDPTEPGDSSKVYIDDSAGLEPSFANQPYELLRQSASGQELKFRTAQAPIAPASILGAETGPFVVSAGMRMTVVGDGVAEEFVINPSNYANMNAATAYELVRDFNSQANIVAFRTINGGKGIVVTDLSGNIEQLSVLAGSLQQVIGFPLAVVRPIFVYVNGEVQSFNGKTGTLSTNPYPWGLVASDLDQVPVIVDGVKQIITITNDDFVEFNTSISSATLSQWATVFSRKVAGVKFTPSGNVLVWSTYQQFSPNGSVQIPTQRDDGSAAPWVSDSKMWKTEASGGTLASEGATKDFKLNRFTGEIEFLRKPAPGSSIEIGSRTTRAQIESFVAPSGLYALDPLPLTFGNSRMVVAFDGDFVIRPVQTAVGATITASRPDAAAPNVVRLTSADVGLFANASVDDWLYLVQDLASVSWGPKVEGLYRLKSVGANVFSTDQTYLALEASTVAGSSLVTVTQVNHGFKTGSRVSITTASAIGGISNTDLSQSLVTIEVINSTQWRYAAAAPASGTATGLLDTVVYDADTWVEFEISQDQDSDWLAIDGVPQSVSEGMVSVFRSTAIPQVVDFGSVATATVDDVISIVSSQIASGSVQKVSPQQFVIRSNDYLAGSVAVLATVGNADSLFETGTATSIQSHIAYSSSGDVKAGSPKVSNTYAPSSAADNKTWRYYLEVDNVLTDVLNTDANPVAESPMPEYPKGFEHLWITGKYAGLRSRVYNNQTAAPFTGIVRAEGAIRPPQTQDSLQSSPDTLNRYANFGIRFSDLALTNRDRLVVEMDLDPVDKTVAIPLAKRAIIEDIDALAGSGPGQVISFSLKDPDDLDPNNSNLPRPFFDSESVYKDYDFRDFRLVTKSVGLYRDFSSFQSYASGSLTAIGSGFGGINDGDTFTISDGVLSDTYEFDSDGITSPGNIVVPFINGEKATGSLTAIAEHPTTGVYDGATFTLDDGVHPQFVFEFDSNGVFTPGNIAIPFVPGAAATGNITAVASDPATGITDGDTFTVDDGVAPVTFEFDTDSSVSPGNVPVIIPVTGTATQVKTAMLLAMTGSSLNMAIVGGIGAQIDLENNDIGTFGNIAITESFVNGVSLFPTGMSGGVDYATASSIKAAMISAINGEAGLDITATSGAGNLIDLENDFNGAYNTPISESFVNSGTLSPVGMSGGVDDATPAEIKSAILSAFGSMTADMSYSSGPGALVYLVNNTPGAGGNVAIAESLGSGTLSPIGMSGGVSGVTTDRALILRSVAMGGQSRLRLSIRYPVLPDEADIVVSHTNTYVGEPQTNILVTLPSGPLTAASTYDIGNYTVTTVPSGTLFRITFSAAGLNPGGEYTVGALLNVTGGPLAGSYYIVSAAAGSVTVLAPSDGGVVSGSIMSAIQYPLNSWELEDATWEDIADAINEYLPENPVATAEAIGTNIDTNPVVFATYIAYQSNTIASSDMNLALNTHSFSCKRSDGAGIFIYDSSVAKGIQATVQSEDSIFPNNTDSAGTTYSPIDEEVALIPSNSKSLTSWLNFNAASSLLVLAKTEETGSSARIQISSREDGSDGAVRVTGVTANRSESFVQGNSSTDGDAVKMKILATDAQSLVSGSFVSVQNSLPTELQRPYRLAPDASSETTYNFGNINNHFRSSNSIKYIRQTANTARIVFYRFGTGEGQSEPLATNDAITLTSLGDGLVQVSSAGGDLAARVGDMMYIKPNSAFAADVRCKGLPASGVTPPALPEYWGYPVVRVVDDTTIVVLAPNITSFGTTNIGSPTDLVFLPAVYNEKNIRTNRSEGALFETPVNGGEVYYLVKKLGGNIVSLWLQNSPDQATDTMRLSDMLVNTDDYVTLGNGFDLANQGTFRILAHNGTNHILFYNPDGGQDEVVDNKTMAGGGFGQRDWKVGPVTSPRPVRIVDGESVRIGDKVRISAPQGPSQWFPDTMIGSFGIRGIGYIGITQAEGTLTAIAANPATGIVDGDFFTINDGSISRTFEFDTGSSVAPGRVRVPITTNATASQVKAAIIEAINSLGVTFKITASSGAGDDINLHNRQLSLAANVAITESISNAQTLSPVGMSGAAATDDAIQVYVDIELPLAPNEILNSSGAPVDKFVIANNDGAFGFTESVPYFGIKLVAGYSTDPVQPDTSDLFLLPKNASGKISETFGSKVSALFKTGFEERTFQGIDGYKVFSGLIQEAHKVIDGLPSNPALYPGVKAMGTFIEVLPPVVRSITIDLSVRPKDGVTLSSINELVRATVSSYVNRLGPGQPVVLSEIVKRVQLLPGVFSVRVLSTLPAAFEDRIVMSTIERPYILNASTDIRIG